MTIDFYNSISLSSYKENILFDRPVILIVIQEIWKQYKAFCKSFELLLNLVIKDEVFLVYQIEFFIL